MQSTLETPRLHLTRLTSAPLPGSPEFAWLHELLSDKGATLWSLAGVSTSESRTSTAISKFLPSPPPPQNIIYAVHERHSDPASTRFIGIVNITTLVPGGPHLRFGPPLVPDLAPTTLLLELAYLFLPVAWGRGLATEAVSEVMRAMRGVGREFWGEWERVWLRVIVNGRNAASGRVMEKVGLEKTGVYQWEGERLWIGGEWAVKDDLVIFGGDLL